MTPRLLSLALFASGAALGQLNTSLAPETSGAFEQYVQSVAPDALQKAKSVEPLPWLGREALPKVREGEVVIRGITGNDARSVPHGLVHDWLGGMFIRGATLANVRQVVQDFSNHKNWYPEVIDSNVLSQKGPEASGSWVLRKKKIITVVLRAELDSVFHPVTPHHGYLVSRSKPIIEVRDYGKRNQADYPSGQGHGFLWRFNGYWNFHEVDEGVYVECRVISLSRDVPSGIGWIVNPFIRSMPRESLQSTLVNTRKAVLGLLRNADEH